MHPQAYGQPPAYMQQEASTTIGPCTEYITQAQLRFACEQRDKIQAAVTNIWPLLTASGLVTFLVGVCYCIRKRLCPTTDYVSYNFNEKNEGMLVLGGDDRNPLKMNAPFAVRHHGSDTFVGGRIEYIENGAPICDKPPDQKQISVLVDPEPGSNRWTGTIGEFKKKFQDIRPDVYKGTRVARVRSEPEVECFC